MQGPSRRALASKVSSNSRSRSVAATTSTEVSGQVPPGNPRSRARKSHTRRTSGPPESKGTSRRAAPGSVPSRGPRRNGLPRRGVAGPVSRLGTTAKTRLPWIGEVGRRGSGPAGWGPWRGTDGPFVVAPSVPVSTRADDSQPRGAPRKHVPKSKEPPTAMRWGSFGSAAGGAAGWRSQRGVLRSRCREYGESFAPSQANRANIWTQPPA